MRNSEFVIKGLRRNYKKNQYGWNVGAIQNRPNKVTCILWNGRFVKRPYKVFIPILFSYSPLQIMICIYSRTWTKEFESLFLFKKTKKESLIIYQTFFGAKGETRQGAALSLLRKNPILCPCSSA